MVESVESRVLLATQPLAFAALGDSLSDEYQFYGPPSAAALIGSLTTGAGNTTDPISNLLGILGSLPSSPTSAPSSLKVTLPPELFLTGRSSASNWVENVATNLSSQVSFGPFSTISRGATREQGYAEDWALSGTTAAGYNYSQTGTTFAQEYEGYPNEFPTTTPVLQPGLVTQSSPTIQDINVVTILIGGNDYAQAAQNYVAHGDKAPLETTAPSGQWVINEAIETSIAAAISAIQTASPNTKIVLMTTPDITISPLVDSLLSVASVFYPNLKGDITRDAADLNTYLKTTYANKAGVGVVDTQQLFTDFTKNPVIDGVTVDMTASGQAITDGFSGDGFHPGTILQGVLSQAIINEINTLYGGNTPAVTPLTDAQVVDYATNSQPAVTLTTSARTTNVGQSVTLSAQVTPAVAGTTAPTGTVTFEVIVTGTPSTFISPFQSPGQILGTVPVSATGGATLTLPALPAGSYQIAAFYSGDPNYEAVITPTTTQTVTTTPAVTSTTLTSSQGVATVGQAVTFTAIVSPNGPGLPIPSGSVTFLDKSTNQTLGTATLNGQGQATLTSSTLAEGPHVVVATYGGTAVLASSTSAAFSQVVNAAPTPPPPPVVVPSPLTTTQLVPLVETVRGRRFVTFQITVTPASPILGVPAGTVTIAYGNNRLRSFTLVQGKASFIVPLGQAARRVAYATFLGQAPFQGSGSTISFISQRAILPLGRSVASMKQRAHANRPFAHHGR
ncbi:Ig-like domain repeat protein [Singulisphaera rosea]